MLTFDDIKQLVSRDESRVLELKQTTGELVKGMQTVCAFLNSDGGWLLFGVTPKLEVLGQNVTDNTLREISREVTKIEPSIELPVEIVDVPGRQGFSVIALHCEPPQFGDAPYTYDGRAFYKVESTTVPMPKTMFEERLRRSKPDRFAWESQTPDNLHLDDLDADRIRGSVLYGISRGRMPASSSTDDTMTLLDKFAMVEGGKLKNAAAALFAKRTTSYPQFLLRLARFRGIEKKEFVDNVRIKGNFFELLDAGMSFFFKHLSQSGVVRGLRREEQLEIPIEALREALTNALCHRLFDSPSGSVGISIFDDRVEIENTGHLPNELTVDTIKLPHRSYPQNPIIAEALFKTAFLESWGTGVGRMVDACRSVGLPEPVYGTDGLFVWITFKRPNLGINSNTNSDTNSDTSLTDRQKEVIAYCFIARTSREILEHIGVTYQNKNISKFINTLINRGFIERTIPNAPNSPKQKYRIKTNKSNK